ncbi:MAG: GNAT family N-acetyltransferase, partial [Bdellovibrionales bacterium]|nr:GNAT family N-acetyltransferase [Bdellovibrionales bacterium]
IFLSEKSPPIPFVSEESSLKVRCGAYSDFSSNEHFLVHLCRLEQEAFPSIGQWSRQVLEASLQISTNRVVVLEHNQNEVTAIIGYGLISVIPPEAEILRFTIGKDFRGRHLGGFLLDHAVTQLRDIGVSEVYLEVNEHNGTALSLYRGRSFFETGRRPGYYDNGTSAAILMRRNV